VPPAHLLRRAFVPALAVLAVLPVLLATAALVPSPAAADDTAGTTDQAAPATTVVIDVTERTITFVHQGTTRNGTRDATDGIDPYGTDPNKEVGYRGDVCRAYRDGRVELIKFLAQQFPAIQDLQGYACREIVAPGTPDCDGEWEPDYSTCWSTHAAGRAIDVMVGGELNSPTPEGVALGDEIVTWLLAARNGHGNYWARKMGIQQILWNDRCWSGQRQDDRYVMSAAEMRWCGIANHDNHVHLTLSNPGADGLTSWYLELGASGIGWG
jgi:hypothetical protein